ncbi:HotDog domain-containing protein [Diplogelasinospora grovesii]|uniref:HotDog domain-containing protein n=1 Tax=Diplogelasinospora grovesii TaxID=303347 RepID=A0AAN6N663_9PEZI|nr:HotDog domain-containing protein [Diplogelasinospora grovesii]
MFCSLIIDSLLHPTISIMSRGSSVPTAAQFFKSIPWCADLLSRPDVVPFIPTCRLEGEDAVRARTQDLLFRRSLNNAESVPHCIGFYRDPASATMSTQSTTLASPLGTPTLYVNSASLLFDLRPGVNGFNGTAHGGLIASLIDEAMGSLILINHIVQGQHEKEGRSLPPGTLDLNNLRVFTASMNVRFQKPVPTPRIVLVTATFVKTEGRKIFLDVRVEDENGIENARCDGLWLSLPLQKV